MGSVREIPFLKYPLARRILSRPNFKPMFPFLAAIDAMPLWAWGAFFLFIIAMLALDLGVFQRDSHVVSMKEALGWCAVWGTLALAFGGGVWHFRGPELGQQFLASYMDLII